jgi:hypothetical protein
MTAKDIAHIAGYDTYMNLAHDFYECCLIEDEPVKLKKGSIYYELYLMGQNEYNRRLSA